MLIEYSRSLGARSATAGLLAVAIAALAGVVPALAGDYRWSIDIPTASYTSQQQFYIEQSTPAEFGCGFSNPPDPSVCVHQVEPPAPFDAAFRPQYCIWDADDTISATFGAGFMDPGASATWTWCLIADRTMHLLHLTAPSPLVGTIAVDNFVTVLVASGSQACVTAPIYNSETNPDFVSIEGSNGGFGNPIVVTFTVTNPTNKRIAKRGPVARLDVALGTFNALNDAWCPSGAMVFQTGVALYPAGHDPQVWWSN